MGRNAAVTYEQVAAEAEQLQAEGVTPSAKLIRSRIGNVGSLATIQAHLMEWRSRQGATQPVTRILPPEVQRAVFKFVDEEVCKVNGELTLKVEQAKSDMADLAGDNEKQTELVRQLRAELEEQATFKAEQAGQLTRLLDELRAAREETSLERRAAELARQELAKIQSRLEAQAPLESELRQLRADFEAEREVRVRAEQNAAVLKAQKDILEARVAELKEAASTQPRIHSVNGEEHVGKKPGHSPQGPGRRGRKAKGASEPSIPDPDHAAGSAAQAAGGPGDDKQAKLC